MAKFLSLILFLFLVTSVKAQEIDMSYLIQLFNAKSSAAETLLLSKGFIFSNYEEENGGVSYTYDYPSIPNSVIIIQKNQVFNSVMFQTTRIEKYLEMKKAITEMKLNYYDEVHAVDGSYWGTVYCKKLQEYQFGQQKYRGDHLFRIYVSDYISINVDRDVFKKHECR